MMLGATPLLLSSCLAPGPPSSRGALPGRASARRGTVGRGALAPARGALRSSPVTAAHPRREENVEGDIFVDSSCIDCDTCRWMAPSVFSAVAGMSAVTKQPGTKEERLAALQALISCPTNSIRTESPPKDIKEAQASFPIPVEGADGVYHLGYHHRSSYGATSYLIVRPEGGNIMVDSPKYAAPLAKRLEALGGVEYMFLTHRDDVADHARWAERFGCTRILHSADVRPGTADVECQLEGVGPWRLPGGGAGEDDVELIFTPGHTPGCVCLLHRPSASLFTGDHLAYSSRVGGLSIFRNYNWHSLPMQVDSLEGLLGLGFERILPGHGRRAAFGSVGEKDQALRALFEEEKSRL